MTIILLLYVRIPVCVRVCVCVTCMSYVCVYILLWYMLLCVVNIIL